MLSIIDYHEKMTLFSRKVKKREGLWNDDWNSEGEIWVKISKTFTLDNTIYMNIESPVNLPMHGNHQLQCHCGTFAISSKRLVNKGRAIAWHYSLVKVAL